MAIEPTHIFINCFPHRSLNSIVLDLMPKCKQQMQPTEKWLLQYEEDINGERHIVESCLYSSKEELLFGIQPLLDSRDAITVSLKRVHTDQLSLVRGEEDNEVAQNVSIANPSSPLHLQLGNSFDIDAIALEDIDLDEILLDDTTMNEMPFLDWQDVCCTFLKNVMSPKKNELITTNALAVFAVLE